MRKDKPKRRKPRPDFVTVPYTVIVDTREQTPWSFEGFKSDKKHNGVNDVKIIVPTQRDCLTTGDYSIAGLENDVTVERKSLNDAFGTFGGGRDRWYREMDRMRSFQSATVIVEADWTSILSFIPMVSKSGRSFTPKQFYRANVSWRIRYPNIQWWFCVSARFAERTCFRTLNRYWELIHE